MTKFYVEAPGDLTARVFTDQEYRPGRPSRYTEIEAETADDARFLAMCKRHGVMLAEKNDQSPYDPARYAEKTARLAASYSEGPAVLMPRRVGMGYGPDMTKKGRLETLLRQEVDAFNDLAARMGAHLSGSQAQAEEARKAERPPIAFAPLPLDDGKPTDAGYDFLHWTLPTIGVASIIVGLIVWYVMR